jgi:hypothetical protein
VKLALHTPKAHHARTKAAAAASEAEKPAEAAPAAPVAAHGSGSHVVQLGAFLSEKNARAACAKALHRDKSLASADVTIAKAVVEGKTFGAYRWAGLMQQRPPANARRSARTAAPALPATTAARAQSWPKSR